MNHTVQAEKVPALLVLTTRTNHAVYTKPHPRHASGHTVTRKASESSHDTLLLTEGQKDTEAKSVL